MCRVIYGLEREQCVRGGKHNSQVSLYAFVFLCLSVPGLPLCVNACVRVCICVSLYR